MSEEGDAPTSDDQATATPRSEYETLYEIFSRERDKEERDYEAYVRTPTYVDDLERAHQAYGEIEVFESGQLVQWKPLMRNQRFPGPGYPAVVVSYIEEPQLRDKDGDLFTEPHDIILGVLDGDQSLRVSSFPSRRFTAWQRG